MGIEITFHESAFKHKGITEEKIRYVLNHPHYEGPAEGDDNTYIVLGFDTAGNLLEILYNFIDETTVDVFHAMKCQSIYFHLLDS
ncbi:MAG: hypothetical protein LBR23_08810 [Spirochaetaceae bacterium]|nr:hypothetical protein [Spirochaetaceae bacterium]